MSTKKLFLSTIVAFILSNLLTTIWYMATDEANMVSYRRAEMNYAGLMANHLLYAALMVYLFPYYYRTNPTLICGFVFGCLGAAMMFLPQAIVVRSIWEVDFNTVFVMNTLAHLVIGGIMGTAIALIFNYKNKQVA